jgi:uncharacterized protein YjiS (DUF1127 family)
LVWVGNNAPRAAAMSTIYRITGLARTTLSQPRDALDNFWGAFQEWRKWERLRRLSDRELVDIAITRSEIDYVASHRGLEPRGIRPGEWLQYLPTADGQIGPIDFR